MARKKSVQFLLRTDEHDAQTLRQKITSSGLSQQDYLLKSALEAPITNPMVYRELLIEYKRQGNNLNQLTRAVNSGGSLSPELIHLINILMKERTYLWQLLKQSTQTPA